MTSDTAFGTGTVEFQHSISSITITRANLVDVNITNDFILNTNAATGFRGPIHAGAGNTLSILSGTIEVQSNVGNGGHFSSLNNGVMRLTGTIHTTVHIVTGATLHLTHAAADTIASLFVDGVQKPAGTYHEENSTFITGTGSLVVTEGTTAYDKWLAAAGLTPGDLGTGPMENADGSSVKNLIQFALGGDPTNPMHNGTYIVFDAGNGVTGDPMILTIAVRAGAAFQGQPSPTATHDGITYAIEGSHNLHQWTAPVEEVMPAHNRNGAITAPPGYELRSFRLATQHAVGPQGFFWV